MALVTVVPSGVVHVATVGAVPVALSPVLGHPLALHASPDELWLLGHVTSPALACTREDYTTLLNPRLHFVDVTVRKLDGVDNRPSTDKLYHFIHFFFFNFLFTCNT